MLREQREHLTPAKLAERAGLDVRTVRRVEAGEAETTWNTIFWIAEALGVSMKEVTDLEEELRREEEERPGGCSTGDGDS